MARVPSIFSAALLAGGLAGQELSEATFADLMQRIVPADDELGWRGVPWRPELRAALVEADAAGKPVLLWAMNGHPLGQT